MKRLRDTSALVALSMLVIFAVPILSVNAQVWPLIWEGDVLSSGGPVTTSVPLELGREYRIDVHGAFIACMNGIIYYAMDAQYYTPGPVTATPAPPPNDWTWDPLNAFPGPDGHSFLQVNGGDENWGPFSNGNPDWTGHDYSISFFGLGAPVTFEIVDWFDGTEFNHYCRIHVRIYEGPRVPRGETAYAYGGPEYATCFRCMDFDMDGKGDFKVWGWSNGPLGPGHYEFDIWAGAAKCDLSKGELAGTLVIDYDGITGTATVTYMMNEDWTMGYAQLYVDGEILPRDPKGEFTVAPGQYSYIHFVDGPTHTFPVSGLSGEIYVVAHADVFEVDA